MRTPRPYRPKVLPGRVTPEQVINLSERDDVEEHQQRLRHEQQDVQKRIARLVAAIENGGDAAPLVAKVRELEARQKTLETEVASLRPGPRLAPAVIADRLAEWRRLLRQSPTQGRTVLQRIVHGRLTFTPRTNVITGEVDGYDFGGQTRFDKLFTGVAIERPAASTRVSSETKASAPRIGCSILRPTNAFAARAQIIDGQEPIFRVRVDIP